MNVEKHLRHKLGSEEAETLLSAAVYLFNIGSNDYFARVQEDYNFFDSQDVQKEYVDMVVGNLTTAIQVMTYSTHLIQRQEFLFLFLFFYKYMR